MRVLNMTQLTISKMKNTNIFFKLIVILALAFSALNAGEGTRVEKTKEIRGYGLTKNKAVENALIEAVKQKHGAYIESVKNVFSSYSQKSLTIDDKSVSSTKMNDAMNQKIRVATSGYIDKYDILDIRKSEDEYEAIIQIKIVEYKTPGNSAHKRRKMVIVPSYTENANFVVFNKGKTSKDVSVNLSQELTNAITQTRRFAILDRGNQSAYASEKQVILSPDAHKDEILKLGQVLGTDYLVVSNIKEFQISKQTKSIQSIGQKTTRLKAYATVQYQILTMATRQIKWSNTVDFALTVKGDNEQQVYFNVMKKISAKLTNEIIENIYPIRVSVSSNGDAVLNQGVPKGAIYDVFSMGKKLYDPYTKEFLGYDEVQTGTIKIVRSLAKVSYGEVIEGTIQNNSIARKSSKKVRKKSSSGNNRGSYDAPATHNGKKSLAIKSLSISGNIDKYKHKYLHDANITVKIKNLVNKSKKYKVLTRDKEQAQALMDENAFADSDLSEEMDRDSMTFANADYQLLPKVTKFKMSTRSKLIEDLEAYENSDYLKLELNVVVIDRKGEVIFESTKSDTYSRSWASESKLKRTKPTYANVDKLAKKIVSSVLYDLLNKKAQVVNENLITVVEVSDETIYLDLGKHTNIEEGDEFPVYKEPKIKTIERTGKTRLSFGSKIATVKIDGIFDDGAEAVVIKGKIKNIKEGYVLRIKKRRGN